MLEIRDASGGVTRRRLDGSPLTVGRALSNDIILDDPYADAHHAHLRVNEDGTLALEDLGSVNGLRLGDSSAQLIAITPGTIVHVGRTTFHFRDVDEAVAPAIREKQADVVAMLTSQPPVSIGRLERFEQRVGNVIRSTRGRFLIVGTELLIGGVVAWLDDYSRNGTSAVLAAILAMVGFQFVWAGIWTMATRAHARRPTLFANYAVTALMAVFAIIATRVSTLVDFLFPTSGVVDVFLGGCFLALLAALVSAHLAIAGVSTHRKRWRTGWITSGAVLGISVVIGLLASDKTNDVPSFRHDIEPVPASVIPAQKIDRISDDLAELKKDVDEAAEKEGVNGR